MEKETFKSYLKSRKKDKLFISIIVIYVFLCLASAVYFCVDFNLRNILLSLLFMAVAPVIFFIEHWFKIRCGSLFTMGLLFIAIGSILGSCFNLYSIIPVFDTVLHGLSGVLFACFGFTLGEKFFGKKEGKKHFFGCVMFGVCFSLAVAVVWELFEYTCTCLLGFDMMEDSIVTEINSYYLSGDHNKAVKLSEITQTVIHYGNDNVYILKGYLDLGLVDTLTDVIVCSAGTLVFVVLSVISYFKYPKINKILIPQTQDKGLVKQNKI